MPSFTTAFPEEFHSYFFFTMIMSNTVEVVVESQKVATHRALGSHSRQALLAVLRRARRPLDAAEAGKAVNLHRNTARTHLHQLESNGLVSRSFEQRATPGRPRVLFQIVPASTRAESSPSADVEYRDLARLLAGELAEDSRARDKSLQAGRRWASALESVPTPRRALSAHATIEAAARILNDLGFEPEPSSLSGPDCIRLRRCPFAEVARENRSVICAVHLGMLEATFERLSPSVSVAGLDPFVTDDPLLCIVRLVTKSKRRKG